MAAAPGTAFPFSSIHVGTPTTTLNGLISIARYCHNIQSLTFPLNPVCPAIEDQKLVREASNQNLKYIWCSFAHLEDPMSAAAFLSDLFPNLVGISPDWPSSSGQESRENEEENELVDNWKKVDEAHRSFVKVRKQERANRITKIGDDLTRTVAGLRI
ncbi:hypothetical protein JAAARDRAFT_189455 [Jaapia argillacea MUCL 33604]|uniref:Uncharacterized protein n=1 Tax=Jaapia argillacea MUCL 33604 TaxID=933084 RepID=A0A067QHJ9_9AGAM|nr:hypothetical protein JAAARDRAFT_189455 [Jaapia argillacea MUCL 33604]